nr:hypothetical protein [Sphingomonas sp. CDS-1]
MIFADDAPRFSDFSFVQSVSDIPLQTRDGEMDFLRLAKQSEPSGEIKLHSCKRGVPALFRDRGEKLPSIARTIRQRPALDAALEGKVDDEAVRGVKLVQCRAGHRRDEKTPVMAFHHNVPAYQVAKRFAHGNGAASQIAGDHPRDDPLSGAISAIFDSAHDLARYFGT